MNPHELAANMVLEKYRLDSVLKSDDVKALKDSIKHYENIVSDIQDSYSDDLTRPYFVSEMYTRALTNISRIKYKISKLEQKLI